MPARKSTSSRPPTSFGFSVEVTQAHIDRSSFVGPRAIAAQGDMPNVALMSPTIDWQFRRRPLRCSFGLNLHHWTPDDSPVTFHERISQ